jgi:hypothetical protein
MQGIQISFRPDQEPMIGQCSLHCAGGSHQDDKSYPSLCAWFNLTAALFWKAQGRSIRMCGGCVGQDRGSAHKGSTTRVGWALSPATTITSTFAHASSSANNSPTWILCRRLDLDQPMAFWRTKSISNRIPKQHPVKAPDWSFGERLDQIHVWRRSLS